MRIDVLHIKKICDLMKVMTDKLDMLVEKELWCCQS
jgi:hypothetical protein